jgi:MFS family permease
MIDPRARDRRILYATAFLRATATGMMGVGLGIYLAALGLSLPSVGYIVAAGLAGGASAALVATLAADGHGRRRMLLELAVLHAAGAAVASATSRPVVLGAAAFIGMLNGMGRDRGAALVIEQSALPATAADTDRTRTLAWYNLLQDAGHALGSLLAGLGPALGRAAGESNISGHRATLVLYAALSLAMITLYRKLSPGIERETRGAPLRVARESRRLLTRISALFALDSLGGGFLTTALLSYFFFERFGVGAVTVGALFFGARVMNALSHLAAAWLAKRIGLVNTMVFTHIPSSLLLVTVAIAPSFPVAAALFLLREGLVEMDVPTRQSYVLAVVRPEERTVASGVTNLVRMAAWAVAPSFAGLLMAGVSLMTPLVIGAAMKITYDVLLYFAFRSVKPPEEIDRNSRRRTGRSHQGG